MFGPGIRCETLRFFCPVFADELALKGLQPLGEVIGVHEVGEVLAQLVVGLLIEPLDGGVLDGAIHPLDLTFCPRCVGLAVR